MAVVGAAFLFAVGGALARNSYVPSDRKGGQLIIPTQSDSADIPKYSTSEDLQSRLLC